MYLPSASACQAVYTKSTCTADSDGCYNPSSCASGYAKSCSSGYSLTSTDGYNCGTCTTDCITDKTVCESNVENSYCYQDGQGCYVLSCKSGYRLKDGACVAFETCEEGGMLSNSIGRNCPGSMLNGMKDIFSYESTIYTGSCSYCCPYNTLEKCQTANPGATCKNIGAYPSMSSFLACYEPASCPAGQKIVDWKCVAVSCEYADQTDCERVNYRSVCTPDANGCYVSTKCENNYYRTGDECAEDRGVWGGMIQDADPYGCGECIEIIF